MNRISLQSRSIEQLVESFIAVALDQDAAIAHDDNAKFNRLYGQMDAMENELKGRDGDQRRALVRLYDHPNAQVRLTSASATLALSPEAARRTLQTISDRQEYPQAADARGMIRSVDDGTFVPG
jgi:hypothetical protein